MATLFERAPEWGTTETATREGFCYRVKIVADDDADAPRADFERLRQWCNDEWRYVGVIVEVERQGVKLATSSLWGIEDDAGDYLREVADELADEALDEAKATLAKLCECEEEA